MTGRMMDEISYSALEAEMLLLYCTFCMYRDFNCWIFYSRGGKLKNTSTRVLEHNSEVVLYSTTFRRTLCSFTLSFTDLLRQSCTILFIITMDQMTTCNMKVASHSDEPTLTLWFFSALQIFLASFNALFCFSGPQLYPFDSLTSQS